MQLSLNNENAVFTVSEFNEFVNLYLSKIGTVNIEGEISGIKITRDKWFFAVLKDQNSSLDIFGMTFRLKGWNIIQDGMKVKVSGYPRLYGKSGRFSFVAENITPSGIGSLKIAYEKLKLQLENEGLFNEDRKRSIPVLPEKIGLITAGDSQAYKDFIKVLNSRTKGIKMLHYPVAVQGKDAVSSIINAFNYFNLIQERLDLIVLIRGGGSIEDLAAFNDESVVRAIFSSKFPVITGIGHEGDITLADFAADLRASTPSNAAELTSAKHDDILKHSQSFIFRIKTNIEITLNSRFQTVTSFMQSISALYKNSNNRLSGAMRILNITPSVLKTLKDIQTDKSVKLVKRNRQILEGQLEKFRNHFNFILRLVENINYSALLNRGFSIVTDESGKIIKYAKMTNLGQNLYNMFSDGKILSVVKNIKLQINESE